MRRGQRTMVIVLVCLWGFFSPVSAKTLEWTGEPGTGMGDWSEPSNWTPQAQPSSKDTVLLETGEAFLSADTEVDSLTLHDATIRATGDAVQLSVTNDLMLHGTMHHGIDQSGVLTSNGQLHVIKGGDQAAHVYSWNINNLGIATIQDSTVWFGAGSNFENANGATFRMDSHSRLAEQFSPTPQRFENYGLVEKVGSEIGQIGLDFTNHTGGMVWLTEGPLDIDQYEDAGGTLQLTEGTNIGFSQPVTLSSGTVQGIGGIHGDLSQEGGVIQPSPGQAGGTLSMYGNFIQNGGSMRFEIAGNRARDEYDTFEVRPHDPANPAPVDTSIGGELDIHFLGGYTPSRGTCFDVVTTEYDMTLSSDMMVTHPALPSDMILKPYRTTLPDGRKTLRLKTDYPGFTFDVTIGSWNDPTAWGDDDGGGLPGPTDDVFLDCNSMISVSIGNLITGITNNLTVGGSCTNGNTAALQIGGAIEASGMVTVHPFGEINFSNGELHAEDTIFNFGNISGQVQDWIGNLQNEAGGSFDAWGLALQGDVHNIGMFSANFDFMSGNITNSGEAMLFFQHYFGQVHNANQAVVNSMYFGEIYGDVVNAGNMSGEMGDVHGSIQNESTGSMLLSADWVEGNVTNSGLLTVQDIMTAHALDNEGECNILGTLSAMEANLSGTTNMDVSSVLDVNSLLIESGGQLWGPSASNEIATAIAGQFESHGVIAGNLSLITQILTNYGELRGRVVVNGTIESNGMLHLSHPAHPFDIGGLLNAQMNNAMNIIQGVNGTTSPGESPGSMSVAEDYTDHGRVIFEIGGLSPIGQYDVITVGQSAVLDGMVEVVLVDMQDLAGNANPFLPEEGDFFDVLIARQIDVALATFDWPDLPKDLEWDWDVVAYDIEPYQSLRLTVTPEPTTMALLLAGAAGMLRKKQGFDRRSS